MNSNQILYPFEYTDQPPLHFNTGLANTTNYWSGTDTEEEYKKNCQDKINSSILTNLGWADSIIKYTRNSHGFRCAEFDNRPSGIALGCSYTEGIGLPVEHTWPYLLSKKLNYNIWNLGVQGGSIDTAFRVGEYYIKLLKPKFVCILLPPPSRFEYHDIENGFPILSHHSMGHRHADFIKEWLVQPFNALYNLKKTLMALEKLCLQESIPLVVSNSQEDDLPIKKDLDLARDLMHKGIKFQTHHMENFYRDLSLLSLQKFTIL